MVSPSIVGDRFIQLAPAYDGGAVLKNNAYLPIDRTAVPVELDQIYQSLDDLSVALGPEGANKEGSLSKLIDGTAAQLDGQGAQLNETIHNFGKLSTTLSNNKDELFGSLREVEEFVKLLKTNDSAVRSFNDSTAQVSTVLAGEREDLKETLRQLSLALVDVNSLVKENRGKLRSNIDNIASLAALLAKHEDELRETDDQRADGTDQRRARLQRHVRKPRHPQRHPRAALRLGHGSHDVRLQPARRDDRGRHVRDAERCARRRAAPEVPEVPSCQSLPRSAAASSARARQRSVADMLAVK